MKEQKDMKQILEEFSKTEFKWTPPKIKYITSDGKTFYDDFEATVHQKNLDYIRNQKIEYKDSAYDTTPLVTMTVGVLIGYILGVIVAYY